MIDVEVYLQLMFFFYFDHNEGADVYHCFINDSMCIRFFRPSMTLATTEMLMGAMAMPHSGVFSTFGPSGYFNLNLFAKVKRCLRLSIQNVSKLYSM